MVSGYQSEELSRTADMGLREVRACECRNDSLRVCRRGVEGGDGGLSERGEGG